MKLYLHEPPPALSQDVPASTLHQVAAACRADLDMALAKADVSPCDVDFASSTELQCMFVCNMPTSIAADS